MRGLLFVAGLCCAVASAQGVNALELARQLANQNTRQAAVAKIVSSGQKTVPILLALARMPPAQVNEYQLFIGLADAFGQLKTEAAIPFLIKHLSIQRDLASPNVWLKTAEVIQQRMPAIAALIQIGPSASKALIGTWPPRQEEDRLATIFVVSQISGVSEARGFLSSAMGEANVEHYWAEEGLKRLGENR